MTKPENKLKIKYKKVLNAYFASRKDEPQYEESTTAAKPKIHTVVSGDVLSAIAKKYSTTVKKLMADNGIKNQNSIAIGQKIKIGTEPEKKKTGDKVTFTKLNAANLGQEVYVVVDTEGLQGNSVALNVKQGKEEKADLETDDKGLMLQHGDKVSTKVVAKVGDFANEEGITNKDDFKDSAIFKFILGDKDPADAAKVIGELTDEKAYMYLLIDAHSTDNIKVTYNGRNPGKDGEPDQTTKPNHWLDLDDKWFELKKGCDCGKKDFDKKFQCTRYGSVYGPVFWGTLKLENYKFWADLIKDKKVTKEEKEILVGMSENEGKLDSVQSYDSELLTVGAMQKTVNPQGKGEFPIQVAAFKKDHPEKYKDLFENCGWTVENDTMYYKDPSDAKATKITGSALKTKIREGFKKSEFKKKLKCKPLEPIAKASQDKDFQARQVKDFIDRLKNKVLPIKPKGYSYTLKDFLKSKLGKATALDHHINRPGYVKNDFGKALDNFFVKKNKEVDDFNKAETDKTKHKTKVSKNPNDWGTNHAAYEKIILDDYGANRRGTDMKGRYDKMVAKF